MGGLEAREAFRPDGQGRLRPQPPNGSNHSPRSLHDATGVTVKQVGPAPGQPTTIVALETAANDWLPGARIPSWPGVPRDSNGEAGDTFAVRPVSLKRYRVRLR
jgi:hypothetical protein